MAGLSQLVAQFSTAFLVLKWLGISFLLLLASRMWFQPVRAAGELLKGEQGCALFGSGIALALRSPKVMVFYMALLLTSIDTRQVDFAL